MKAPDKIYIPIHQSYPNAPIDEKNTHLGADWYVSKCDQTAVGFQEYIRKDAILEWLEQELAQRHDKKGNSHNKLLGYDYERRLETFFHIH